MAELMKDLTHIKDMLSALMERMDDMERRLTDMEEVTHRG